MTICMNGEVKSVSPLPTRFERKYYVPPDKVELAYSLLNHTCMKAGDYPSEQICSLYFDTLDLDQYEASMSGDYMKDKVRIRWYSDGNDVFNNHIFVELKSRHGFETTKQRLEMEVPAENIYMDGLRRGIITNWLLASTLTSFGYATQKVLLPIIKIHYWRYRFIDMLTGQRISLDTRIRSTMILSGWGNGEKDLELTGGVIEIKGNNMELPVSLECLRYLDTDWTRFSKYSACIDSHEDRPGIYGRLSPTGRAIPN